MKIHQKEPKFNPINIQLTTKKEAEEFVMLMDMIEGSIKGGLTLTTTQKRMVLEISNAFTNQRVTY